jgi:hypothetical protein
MPCPGCGMSVERTLKHLHVCDPDRRLEYELFQLRHETALFEPQLAEYLESPAGRFEVWLAEHDRLGHATC